jgi:ATP-dependent DNA helicase RecQ
MTYKLYSNSDSLVYVKNCITKFETTNKIKYYSDFKEYVFESSIEDFGDYSDSDVIVSTIHKAKGHEFDDVYMLVNGGYTKDDELMRRYYVAITRAKKRLFIHTNTNIFDNIAVDAKYIDSKLYDTPEEIVIQMTHKDVNLGFFKNRKNEVLALRGGSILNYAAHHLYDSNNRCVAKLSNRMQQTLAEWEEKGYDVYDAKVRFIVAWKPQDAPKEEKEIAVILPDLYLKKRQS